MSKTQNNKLPMIMLPIAMVVAGIVSGLPTTLVNLIYPFIISNMGLVLPDNGMMLMSNIGSVLGAVGYLVVLILFSLCCKGLTKKLWFIMSVYVGSIVDMVISVSSFIFSLVFAFLPVGDMYLQTTIYGASVTVSSLLSMALEIVVASLFFNMILKYTEKDISEESDEPYKLKMVVPGIMIAVCGIIMTGTGLISNLISAWITTKFCSGTWDQFSVIYAFNIATHIIIWVAIIVSALFIKGKYQKLSFVGSIVAGRYLWNFLGSIQNLIVSIIPGAANILTILWSVTLFVLGVVAGIFIFYIANKKQYEIIRK